MTDAELVFDPLPSEPLTRLVSDGVELHAIAATGLADWHPVNYFLRSPAGEWQGGLLGMAWGGWLRVRMLWVAAHVRGRGHGGRLLRAAEAFARERGCIGATLETHSFQARPFYEAQGYEVFATLDDYPVGHTRYFLRKRLVADAATPEMPR